MTGKVLSGKNKSSLVQIHSNLTKMLLESGVSKEVLLSAIAESEINIISAASSFAETVAESIWFDNVISVIEILTMQLYQVGCWNSEGHDTIAVISASKQIVADFEKVMTGYLDNIPAIEAEVYYPMYCSKAATKPLKAEAGFTKNYEERVWEEKIDIACRMFKSAIWNIVYEFKLSQTECATEAKGVLAQLCAILANAIADCPASKNSIKAAADVEPEAKLEPEPEPEPELPSIEITAASIEKITEADKDTKVAIEIRCSALKADAAKVDLNRQPFSGVLFRVDEISDGAPAAGPTTKLFVPRVTAQKAVDIINASGGMPLDIKDDMSGHNDSNITGIMTSAAIVGNDCVVYGHLFPYNKPAESLAIVKHVEDLGMSINAEAASHDVSMTNPLTGEMETVAWIDELYPLGANILFSKLATWQSTKVLQAEAKPVDTSLKEEELSTKTNNDMNNENNSAPNTPSLETIQSMLGNFIQASQKETQDLKQEIKDGFKIVDDRVNKLEASARERDETIVALKAEKAEKAAAAAAAAEQEKAKTQVEQMAQMVQAAVQKAINPNAHPASLTSVEPLVAQASATQSAATPSKTQLQLLAAEARLEAYETSGVVGTDRIKTSDEIKRLKSQLQSERRSALGYAT